MHECNSVTASVSARPTPLYMAVDAVLSTMQNKYSEAERILEDALNLSPGNTDLLKGMGYLRWKEGKMAELIERNGTTAK